MKFKLSGAGSNLLNPNESFSLNFTVSACVRGTFTLEKIQDALERLRHHHPLLAARMAPATDNAPACLTTEGVPAIPLRRVERLSAQDWVHEVEREIVQPTNYATGPLFKCVWVCGEEVSDLILVCDHIAGDGFAGIYALRSLLELLANPDAHPEPIFSPTLAELLPPSALTRINEIISAAANAATDANLNLRARNANNEPLRVLPFAFDEAQTSELVSRCHAENVTVQAALCTAFALTFAELHPDVPVRRIESPVSVRHRLLQPVGEVYGNYISLINSDIDCTPGQNPWEIARKVRRSLTEATDEQLFTIPLILMAVADKPLQGPVVEINYDLSISNLGRINIPARYGAFQLESIYAPTMGPASPAHRILGVTTFNGQMRCTFTSYDPQAPQIIQRTREILNEMLFTHEST